MFWKFHLYMWLYHELPFGYILMDYALLLYMSDWYELGLKDMAQ